MRSDAVNFYFQCRIRLRIRISGTLCSNCLIVFAFFRSHASQKAELIRAISLTSGLTGKPSRNRECDVDLSAADILYRGATAVTTHAADDPMNCTLEDLIVKNLDRDSATLNATTVVRGIRPLSAPNKQQRPPCGAAPSSSSASNSPDTNEASPGDSDYESESNGIPLLKVRTPPAKTPSSASTAATSSSSVDFNQTIKKSIKDLFMK